MFSKTTSIIMSLAVGLTLLASAFLPTTSYAKPNSEVNWGCAAWEEVYLDDFGCPSNVDIVTSPWIITDYEAYHTTWLNFFNLPQNQNKTPYIHTYIMAGLARRDWGLQDCNVDPVVNLCWRGATYIRQNSQSILNKYQSVANSIAQNLTTDNVYIHIEPDYFQYTADTQENPLTNQEAWNLMNQVTTIFKNTVPQAKLVMDISAWNYSMSNWCSGFENFDYGGLVGNYFSSNVAPAGQSYSKIVNDCGYELIVNTAHGVGGAFHPYNPTWEVNNQGVHAIIQSPLEKNRYQQFLTTIKNQPTKNLPSSYKPAPVTSFQTNQQKEIDPAQSNTQADPNNPTEYNQEKIKIGEDSKEIIVINDVEYYSTPQIEEMIQSLKKVQK